MINTLSSILTFFFLAASHDEIQSLIKAEGKARACKDEPECRGDFRQKTGLLVILSSA